MRTRLENVRIDLDFGEIQINDGNLKLGFDDFEFKSLLAFVVTVKTNDTGSFEEMVRAWTRKGADWEAITRHCSDEAAFDAPILSMCKNMEFWDEEYTDDLVATIKESFKLYPKAKFGEHVGNVSAQIVEHIWKQTDRKAQLDEREFVRKHHKDLEEALKEQVFGNTDFFLKTQICTVDDIFAEIWKKYVVSTYDEAMRAVLKESGVGKAAEKADASEN